MTKAVVRSGSAPRSNSPEWRVREEPGRPVENSSSEVSDRRLTTDKSGVLYGRDTCDGARTAELFDAWSRREGCDEPQKWPCGRL